MNKIAVLALEMADGGWKCVPELSVIPLIDQARQIRDSGLLNGEAVKSGIVLASWKPVPPMKFSCKPAQPAVQPKPRRTRKTE